MVNENSFMLHAFCLGVYITFVYDFFRILRRVFAHTGFWISLEDLGFWGYCAVKVFLMMQRESDGTMRWFAVMGALIGMLLYRKLCSRWYVEYVSRALIFLKICILKVGRAIGRPIKAMRNRLAAGRAAAKHKVAMRAGFLKKRLTVWRKLIKMEPRKERGNGKKKSRLSKKTSE